MPSAPGAPPCFDERMGIPYDERSEAEQVEALRPTALLAAAELGLEVARLELVLHGYNTTFGLHAADGRRFALRVGTNSQSTREHAIAQQAWQRAIAAETDVRVPVPLATPAGEWCVEVDNDTVGRPLLVTASSWLEGPDAEVLDVDAARALGRAMAALHAHAEGWRVPEDGTLTRFVEPLFGDRDALDETPGLDRDGRAALAAARERAGEAFERLHRGAALRALHADLHSGNLKWHEGRIAVFDFDDAGLGIPALDLAISAFYLRGGDDALEPALRAGYAEVAPLPELDPADHEALVAARQLLLLNAVLTSSTADLRAQAVDYAQVSLARLRHWLRTGAFTRAVA